MTSQPEGQPYIYHRNGGRKVLCAKCGQELRDGDKTVRRQAYHRRHLGYTAGNHVIHSKHYVDAHGEPIF